MSPEPTPTLPFSAFKWRWASAQPTEGLNDPEVFLGVLRALRANEGERKNSLELYVALSDLEDDIKPRGGLKLARDPERNLLRNAGQYWTSLDLLEDAPAIISLTPLGRSYADRLFTQTDFALHTVLNFHLPSNVYPNVESSLWATAGIRFRPLLLILDVISQLAMISSSDAQLSESELLSIVQPLSAVTQDPARIANAVFDHRQGLLSLEGWPNVATRSNDRRMSDEFLAFLANYGLLVRSNGPSSDRVYRLAPGAAEAIGVISALPSTALLGSSALEANVTVESREFERKRTIRGVWDRPGQKKFREDVLTASGRTCLLTATKVESVLEAAHIRPVSKLGSDLAGNGFCLRSDLHLLFDSNRIRIAPSGAVTYSPEVSGDPTYSSLPSSVVLPPYVDPGEVFWRWSFT